MKAKVLTALCLIAAIANGASEQREPVVAGDADHAPLYENKVERDARMSWWREAKFGMFIHYGLYSALGGEFKGRPGGGEWLQTNLGLDTDTYAEETLPIFKPAKGCTEQWAKLAELAGCRYMVLTSKHHEGFALFDTETTDYSAKKVAGRDIVREFVESARKHNQRVGFYHSVIDWHHPSYDNTISPGLCYPKGQAAMLAAKGIPRDHETYLTYLHKQVRELLTHYGKIDIIWWDYSQGALSGERGWHAPKLIQMARELQPGIVMNNRLYAYSGYEEANDAMQLDLRCGDFMTPEKRLPKAGCGGTDWESCMTLGNHWGYNKNDVKAYKSPERIIRQLEQCAAYGGNLLLNISPREDGTVTPETVLLFERIGRWMAVNGEAVYGSSPVPGVSLPEGWMASIVGEDTYIFPPALKPKEAVELRIPAHEIDTVSPSVLGQPGCKVTVRRIEEPGEDEPKAFMQFIIPASAWENAVEGLPVIKLSNAH